MCGIFVYISKNAHCLDVLNENSDKIKHRGPDKTSLKIFKTQSFYIYTKFHRLSIIQSTDKGDQPFIIEKALTKYVLLCNGEIYNYKKLVQEHDLTKDQSDCYCILELYLKYGIQKTLDLIDNEFAFVILEINEYSDSVKIITSRDKFGIRPLFYNFKNDTLIISSELKSINKIINDVKIFPPRQYMVCKNLNNLSFVKYYDLHKFIYDEKMISDQDFIYDKIKNILINSVQERLQSDESIEIGCLLSGGLDSSLVSSIACSILKKNGKNLKTFSIGFENSEDLKYAKIVADHIGSDHTELIVSKETALNTISEVVYILETYDITTIRASTFQYLISKYIKENTNIKILINGDGSDEIFSGYFYNYFNKDNQNAHDDTIRLLNNIHIYDVLRSDRGISYNGMESRCPFLCTELVEFILKVHPKLRIPIKNEKIEKYILRKAFENSDYLPQEVLFRNKTAFSDGISNSKTNYWYQDIQEYIEKMNIQDKKFTYMPPISKESLYYRILFDKYFPNNEKILNHYWMPNFIDANDPSAKTLAI